VRSVGETVHAGQVLFELYFACTGHGRQPIPAGPQLAGACRKSLCERAADICLTDDLIADLRERRRTVGGFQHAQARPVS